MENRIDWEPGKYGSEGNIYRNALKQVGAICLKNNSAIFDTEIRITAWTWTKIFIKKLWYTPYHLCHPII